MGAEIVDETDAVVDLQKLAPQRKQRKAALIRQRIERANFHAPAIRCDDPSFSECISDGVLARTFFR